MRLEPPRWWHGTQPTDRLMASLLQPLGWVYGAGVRLRFAKTTPYRSRLPVICIGNFTLGGAGKTPLALAVAAMLAEMGQRPAFLTRGYGGRLIGPHRVEPGRDTAADVGDEPLLLARASPTILAHRRPEGAKTIEQLGASVIIMDDGFQNPSLVKDLCLIAVDGGAGLGNGRVFPAGPLRAPLEFQMSKADAVVTIGGGASAQNAFSSLSVFHAQITPAQNSDWLREQPVIAFCGIGRPAKFFATLEAASARILARHAFPDHHSFSESEALTLLEAAKSAGAILVTTEKDWVRIPSQPGFLGALKTAVRPLAISLRFAPDAEAALREMLSQLIKRHTGL